MKFSLVNVVMLLMIMELNWMAQVSAKPLTSPEMFDNGPAPIIAIKQEIDKVTVVVLLEGVMGVVSSAVLASSCKALEGNYPISVNVDGVINKPETNVAKITSPGNPESLVLKATINSANSFLGKSIKIRQAKSSKLKQTVVSEFTSVASINHELTLLSMSSDAKALGQNGIQSSYQKQLIQHYYQAQSKDNKTQYILGWGAVSVSKAGYPVNQFWSRFKADRANGQLKRIILQEDRVVGTSFCRIVVDGSVDIAKESEAEKKKSIVYKGMLMITRSPPHEELTLLNEF